jgi:hypothetical protein
MPVTHLNVRDARRWRIAARIRRAALLAAGAGMMAGAALATAGLARASASAPGGLIFSPASGTATSVPTWSTTSGCPIGYQGSAEMAEFKADGTVASRISPVVNSGLTAAFKGTLDGNVAALLRVTEIKNGGAVKVAIGCYSLEGGTGKLTWNQTATITLSSAGTSYSTSTSASESPSPGPTSSVLPSAGAETGAGGASLPGHGNGLLIALGGVLLAGSATATVLAIRRQRGQPVPGGTGDTWPAGK